MKKVVLLAGALAMGMASAPMAANAANPAVNDVQEVNLTRSQIESVLNEARVLQAKYHTVMGHARFTDDSVVPADTQKKIQKAYNHVTSLIEEGEKLIDGKVNASLIFYATGVEQGEFKFNPNLSTMPEWVKDYKDLTSKSTIADLLEKQTVAYSAILASTVSYLETYDNLTALFADKTEQLRAIVNTISNLGDTVYGSDAEELLKKLQALQSDGDDTNFVDFADFQNGLSAGNLTEKVNDFMELLETLQEGLDDLNSDVVAAVKVKAANVVAAEELTGLFKNLVDIVKTAPVGDVYESDATNLETKRAEVLGHIQVEIGYIAADLLTGDVLDNRANTMEAYQAMLDEVNGFQGQIKDAEKYLADSKAKAAELTSDVDDLVVLLRSALPGDVYDDIESDKDLAALYDLYEALSDDLLAENAAIATDLADRAILDNAAAHEAAISALSIRVAEYQGKVKEYEQFKADNQAARDALVNDLTNLLVTVDGLKKYGDVYEEDAQGFDAETIDRAIEQLETSITNDLNFLQNIDYPAGEVLENVLAYKDGINTYKEEIESIKETIAQAEQLYAMNLRALNNLEEHIKAVETVLHTTKAMCACNECNEEDQAEVDALLTTLDGILDDVNTAFTDTKDLWQQEGVFNGQVEDVEADAANLLALIQLHLDTAQNDLRVYNTLQALLANTVDAEMLKLEAEEGYKCFANRDAYHNEDYNPERPHFHDGATTNPNVKYGNELAQKVEDLKAEIERQHSHEGGHTCEENKLADVKAMNDIVAEIQKTIAAVKANEAAHKLLQDRFAELFADAKDAYEFWHQYYSTATLITHEGDIANWIQEWNGELENGYVLAGLENLLHDYYVHGNAANAWTVDGKGEELNGDANDKFAGYDEDLANDRNELAYTEALNHYAQVKEFVDTYYNNTVADYSSEVDGVTSWDPFVRKWENGKFVGVYEDWYEEVEGEYGLYASLRTFKEDIEAAYAEGVMEDAINIDEHNTALGIHQQLDGVLGVLSQIEAEYEPLFEAAHHLTNGKTIYSDQEYFTLGFFQKANDGSVANGQEMFDEVKVLVNDDIRLYDSRSYVWNDMGTDDWSDDEALLDEKGRVVYDKVNNAGEIAEVTVLTVGAKSNELAFNFHQNPMALERTTLKAGTAEVDFLPGSISVKKNIGMAEPWTLKHTVSIDGIDVLAPEMAEIDITPYAASNKLILRLDAPIDLTYTINSLVARTDDGTEFSYADRELNYAARTIEFTLPEGTASVELPEGFFTFRTGENSIARSAAKVVAVGGTQTSIDALIAMGEKAQVFDLQGRRVNVETLVKGNTYVVNGVKTIVK